MDETELEQQCYIKALYMIEKDHVHLGTDVLELTNMLIGLEKEKIYKNSLSDNQISFNDEIVEIEELGILDTIDISVSGDNLFYANNILTKNSFGLPATLDAMFALISSDELKELGQIMVRQLKNRFANLDKMKRFVLGIDRMKMRLFDVERSAQDLIDPSNGEVSSSEQKPFNKNKYKDFK